jgi:hypothetical protein
MGQDRDAGLTLVEKAHMAGGFISTTDSEVREKSAGIE